MGAVSSASKRTGGNISGAGKEFVGKISGIATGKGAISEFTARQNERAAKSRRGEASRLRRDQKRASKKVEKIFKRLRDPRATKSDLKKGLAQIKRIDTSGFTKRAQGDIERLRQIGQTEGLTEGGKALTAQQRAEQAIGLEEAELSGQQQAQSAFESLASRGGASAAAQERLLGQTGSSAIREQQRLRRSGAAQRLGISAEDEASKLGILGGLSAQEVAAGTLSGKTQEAEARQALARQQSLQGAREFDVGGVQRSRELRATGQAQAIQGASQQATQFGAAQQLAAAQRKAAADQKGGGGPLGSILKPVTSLFS